MKNAFYLFINFNDMWYNKKTIFRTVCLLLMFSGSANAQPSLSHRTLHS